MNHHLDGRGDDLLLSLAIPVRDDEENLRSVLEALAEMDLSRCEVLICDDGSQEALQRSSLAILPEDFRLWRLEGSGPAAARNYLAHQAGGKYLFFLDSDTVPAWDALSLAKRIAEEHPELDAFIGSYDDSPLHHSLVSLYKNLSHHFVHQQSEGMISTFWTGCGVIKRSRFLEMGGFDTHFSKPSVEDIELGMRLSQSGGKIRLFPELQVCHRKFWSLLDWMHTDLFRRGIPWVRIMASRNQWTSQLNFTWRNRFAALLLLLSLACLASSLFHGVFWAVGLAGFLLFFALQYDLFLFLARREPPVRVLLMAPLHILYVLISTLSLAVGLILGSWDRIRSRTSDR